MRRVGSLEASVWSRVPGLTYLFPPLPGPSWVSPLHRAESQAPHQEVRSVSWTEAPPLESLWQVLGSQGDTWSQQVWMAAAARGLT